MNRRSILVGVGSAALLVAANIVHAADPALITISVKGMQCAACSGHVSESL